MKPLPSGIETSSVERIWSQSTLDNYVAPYIAKNIYDIWENIRDFFQEHALVIFIIIFVIGAVNYAYSALKKRRYNIQKLWNFTLFFLSKRLMMIPLLATLGKRAGALDKDAFKKLLDLRDECRDHSFLHDPQERIKTEIEISKILMQYFEKIEEKGLLKNDSVFFHIVDDLEYIDKKLVELQEIYNYQATKWNKWFGKNFFSLIGLKPFKLFH